MSNWARGYLIAIFVTLMVAVMFATYGVRDLPESATWAAGSLGVLALLLAAWFLHSFVFSVLPTTGPERDAALTDIYAFAYTFTLLSLALLALPFGNLLNDQSFPETGPIRLIRGCVVPDSKAGDLKTSGSTSGSAGSMPETSAPAPSKPNPSPSSKKSTEKRPATTNHAASSGTSANSPNETASAKPPTAQSAAASEPDRPKWPQGLPLCGGDPQDTHTVLVTIGGVIASSVPAHVASASATAQSPSGASAPEPRHPGAIYQVRDGFVVSLTMVALAIVGAVVNLMRRVPEFQKRAHLGFMGTTNETPLQPCEAREFVAFQILQLIAAPFIAMVAMYVIAPNSLPSAIALAFVSGLFSEGVLLRIRALVEGPEKTQTQAETQLLGELEIGVTSGGVALPGATVTVISIASGRNFTEAVSDSRGLVVLKGVPIGALRISAVGPAPGFLAALPKEIALSAGQRKHIELTV
jgi:hypothetical protein